jgi:hypothetical protein
MLTDRADPTTLQSATPYLAAGAMFGRAGPNPVTGKRSPSAGYDPSTAVMAHSESVLRVPERSTARSRRSFLTCLDVNDLVAHPPTVRTSAESSGALIDDRLLTRWLIDCQPHRKAATFMSDDQARLSKFC